MFLRPPEFTLLPKARTKGEEYPRDKWPWKGAYETYRLNVDIPGVRLHAKRSPQFGRWFGVDRYNERVDKYRHALALVNPAEVGESFVLVQGGVYNVGIANLQRDEGTGRILPGGGYQFEYVTGTPPQHIEHVKGLKRSTRVPL